MLYDLLYIYYIFTCILCFLILFYISIFILFAVKFINYMYKAVVMQNSYHNKNIFFQ